MNLYREYPPHPALAGHVACLWASRMEPDQEPVRHRVLPDNCIDILWQDRAPTGFVAGMMSRPHRVVTAEAVRTVAVRFLPGAARAFFDLPLHALQDHHVALDALWPRAETEALAAALWERDRSTRHRLQTLEDALLARLRAGTAAPADHMARAAVRLLEDTGGALRIGELADALGVSRQHLAQQFRERVGLNAKTFAMVCRFRRTTAELRRLRGVDGRRIDWASLAADCGYYDQSHLIHAFQLFAEETPDSFALARG